MPKPKMLELRHNKRISHSVGRNIVKESPLYHQHLTQDNREQLIHRLNKPWDHKKNLPKTVDNSPNVYATPQPIDITASISPPPKKPVK